jgi:aspartyl-tRNA(Asn)/glutamyl-tRNA(Gln) amidotransferase subunit A
MTVIGHPCDRDATCLDLPPESYPLKKTDLKETTFAICPDFIKDLSVESLSNFLSAVQVMKDLGAKIIEVNLDILKYCISVYQVLATAEASTNLARFDGIRYGKRSKEAYDLESVYQMSRHDGFGAEVKRRIMLGTFVLSSGYRDAYYTKAQKVRSFIRKSLNEVFQSCDALLLPTTPSSAFEKGALHEPLSLYLQDIFTIPANLAGLPSISVPSGYDKKGLPLGLQIVGPSLCDVLVVQYAYAYEQATLHNKIPPTYA